MTSSSSGCRPGNSKYLLPVAVDIGLRGLARRLGVEFLFQTLAKSLRLVAIHPAPGGKDRQPAAASARNSNWIKLHPADLAEIIEDLDYKKRTDFIEDLDVEIAAEAFAEMELDTQIEILEHMDSQQASDLLEEMPPDEAADLLAELPEEKSDELLNLMEPEEAQEVRELMDYEEGTAGALMTTEYIALSPEITVAEAFPAIADTGGGSGDHLLSLHPEGRRDPDRGHLPAGTPDRRARNQAGRT